MAKIVDPDQLTQATEVTFATSTLKIDLALAGNLDDNSPGKSSGVTHQALYSFAKEEWLATAALQKIRFPFDPIFEAKFDWINDWQPEDQQTIDLIRDGGFRIVILNDEYMSVISLQSMSASTDQSYYWQTAGFTATTTNYDKTGELNEPVLIYDGTTDWRGFFKTALRLDNKTYSEGNLLVDQDLATLTYQAYRIPLSNATDVNKTETDANIDSQTPYTNMRLNFLKGSGFTTWANSTVYAAGAVVLDPIRQSGGSSNGTWWFTVAGGTSSGTGTADDVGVTWESYVGEEQIGTEWFAFNRIIDTSTGTYTRAQAYNFIHRQLRLTGDINDNALGGANQGAFGVVNGNVARLLGDFVGADLVTRPGVLLRNFDTNDTNNIKLSDITVDGGGLDSESVPVTSTVRTFPFVSAWTYVFSANLVAEADVDTVYKSFFEYSTRDTGTDIAVTAASGATATLTSTSTNFTTNFSNGDYLAISGFLTNAVNNGLFQVNGAPTTTTCPVRKVNGETLINETAGDSVNLDADPYGTPDAIIVNDNGGSPLTGQITAASIAADYDYDGNVQRGAGTGGTPAPIVTIAQGIQGAQVVTPVKTTITAATGITINVNAGPERVYANP